METAVARGEEARLGERVGRCHDALLILRRCRCRATRPQQGRRGRGADGMSPAAQPAAQPPANAPILISFPAAALQQNQCWRLGWRRVPGCCGAGAGSIKMSRMGPAGYAAGWVGLRLAGPACPPCTRLKREQVGCSKPPSRLRVLPPVRPPCPPTQPTCPPHAAPRCPALAPSRPPA